MNVFGFEIKRGKESTEEQSSVVSPPSNDGSIVVESNGNGGGYGNAWAYDPDGAITTEHDLIRRYRELTNVPEVAEAIEDIVNETISITSEDPPVDISLDELKVSEPLKKKIKDSFDEVIKVLNFNEIGYEIFEKWYVDGKIYYQILLDQNDVKAGIVELREIDPRKIKKVKKINKKRLASGVEVIDSTEEFFVFNEKGITDATSSGTKLSKDSIVYVTSGLYDQYSGLIHSHLKKAIRPANQLRMLEDAVVIYRLTRAPERRIFYIDVGNLPKGKAEQYVNDTMNKFKNKLVYNAHTGEVADSKKHMCLAMDTKVPLLDGRTLTIQEISEQYQDTDLWAYSCDPKTGKFAPGLITWAGVARKNSKVMRLTLDNGKTMVCTPDHKFPVWNKGLVEAQDLVIGESMVPLYKKNVPISANKGAKEYEQFFLNDEKVWKFTHRAVSGWKDEVGIANEFLFNELYKDENKHTIHHKNINRFDNSPGNLVRMNGKDHMEWHRDSGSKSGVIGGKKCYEMRAGFHNKNHPKYGEWQRNAGLIGGRVSSDNGASAANYAKGRKIFAESMKDEEYNNWFRQQQSNGWSEEAKAATGKRASESGLSAKGNVVLKELWKTPEKQQKHREMYATSYNEKMFEVVHKGASDNLTVKATVALLNNSGLVSDLLELNKNKSTGNKTFGVFNSGDVNRIVSKNTDSVSFTKYKDQLSHRNHKITNIEYLVEEIDTGCLTIGGEHEYHTFALESGIYTQNSMMEDFWLARRDGGKGTEVTTLPGGQNLGQMDDVDYFKDKLYHALNVPISRMKPDAGFTLGRSTEISRDEIKFAKFIEKLRSRFNGLFFSILKIQLIAKGILSEDDWDQIKSDIKFKYAKDNFFSELKEQEILQSRIQAAMLIDPEVVKKAYSIEYIQKKILKLTDEEIEEIKKQRDQEAIDNPPLEEPPEAQ